MQDEAQRLQEVIGSCTDALEALRALPDPAHVAGDDLVRILERERAEAIARLAELGSNSDSSSAYAAVPIRDRARRVSLRLR